MNMTTTYESTVEYNEDFKEYFLTIPEELIERLGWEEGDMLEWHLNKDGTVLLERVDEYTAE
jgi:bifunctional DNA-binding transcriptional regulator/antitoxin component of YhaV-PrlF toxin-antitoxin module